MRPLKPVNFDRLKVIQRVTSSICRSPEMVDLYSGYPIGLKADIWALGVLLYHLCFFQLPFNTQLAIQTGEVAVPDASTFSIDIHKVIRLCLQVMQLFTPDCHCLFTLQSV